MLLGFAVFTTFAQLAGTDIAIILAMTSFSTIPTFQLAAGGTSGLVLRILTTSGVLAMCVKGGFGLIDISLTDFFVDEASDDIGNSDMIGVRGIGQKRLEVHDERGIGIGKTTSKSVDVIERLNRAAEVFKFAGESFNRGDVVTELEIVIVHQGVESFSISGDGALTTSVKEKGETIPGLLQIATLALDKVLCHDVKSDLRIGYCGLLLPSLHRSAILTSHGARLITSDNIVNVGLDKMCGHVLFPVQIVLTAEGFQSDLGHCCGMGVRKEGENIDQEMCRYKTRGLLRVSGIDGIDGA